MAASIVHVDFLIIGAGPVGLMLALALRNAGLGVLVAEQVRSAAHRSPFSKALSLNAGTLETFRYHGLDDEVMRIGEPAHHVDFGLLPNTIKFSPERLGVKHPHNLVLAQNKTQDVLLKRCEENGVLFRWGLKFDSLRQDALHVTALFTQDSVTPVATTSNVTVEADWLIGCDGSHSAVRQCVEIDFPGNSATCFSWLADVRFAEAGPRFAFRRGEKGPILIFGLGDDTYRVIGFYQENKRPNEAPSVGQISTWLREYFSTDFGVHDPLWISVFGNATRVAETFQRGRVFLAGDAAHQHYPAGGQGINMGIQDRSTLLGS